MPKAPKKNENDGDSARKITCPTCSGSGVVTNAPVGVQCPACIGTGWQR